MAVAAPTVTVTNEGTPHDRFGDTAVNGTSFLLTVNADPGDKIAGFDLGASSNSTSGLFGPFLQHWLTNGKTPPTPTPVDSSLNGARLSLDTHIVVPNTPNLISSFRSKTRTR